MKRVVVAFVLFLSLFIQPLKATDWAEVIKQVERSVVFVEVGSSGSCTGFVIDQARHYVMTAAHCQPEDMGRGVLWVDRVPARVVSMDSKKDLLVVEAKDIDPTRPALKLASANPARGQEVMSCGYGYGLERPFYRGAHIQDDAFMMPEGGVGGPYISTDAPFVGGQSGGPVVDLAGNVVLIVQRGDGGTTGIGVGVEIIRERMGRFFGK